MRDFPAQFWTPLVGFCRDARTDRSDGLTSVTGSYHFELSEKFIVSLSVTLNQFNPDFAE